MERKGQDFIYRPVTNADGFDRMSFEKIYHMSSEFKKMEEKGHITPSYSSLLGDVWSCLYKLQPQLLQKEEVHPSVKMNIPVMEKVLNDPAIQELRQTTLLDELASALGTMRMNDKLKIIMQQHLQKVREKEQQAADAEKHAEDIASALENPNIELSEKDRKMLQDEMNSYLSDAAQYYAEAAAEMEKQMEGHAGKLLTQAIGTALNETVQDVKNVQSMVSALGHGTGKGELQKMSLKERIALGQVLRKSPKVKEVAAIAGRMKAIAKRKQKSKSKQSVGMGGITFGADIKRFLPSELLLYNQPATRLDFLKRFGEKKIMQYSPNHNEKLGQGPVVVLIDSSGSMKGLDVQSKGIMIALLAIAKKEKRPFAVINFANRDQCKTWSFPKANPSGKELVEIIEHFFNGGTDFERPLSEALKIMDSSTYNEGDIVFITDGDARISENFLNTFKEKQKQKQFQVISIQIGEERSHTLKSFSNEVIRATSLFDEKVTDKVFAI